MNEEVTTTNNSEQRITIDKPEKDPRKVAAGKYLAEYNKAMKKKKELGETEKPERPEESVRENSNDNEEMSGTTKILLLLEAAGLGYYLYTTTINNSKEEVKKNVQQPTVQSNNNEVQENTISRLRSFKN